MHNNVFVEVAAVYKMKEYEKPIHVNYSTQGKITE